MVWWLTLYSIAMAYLESAVVVYLRQIYYPLGFSFPIMDTTVSTVYIEVGREAATIVMLLAIAKIAYRRGLQQFCTFVYCFGIWDIFYYLWLYVFIHWPESLNTWDVLFLIPVPWTGPVLAPILVSLSLIITSLLVLRLTSKGVAFHLTIIHWILAVAGGLLIILSFTLDYQIVIQHTRPANFHWEIFASGLILGIGTFIQAYFSALKRPRTSASNELGSDLN
jgi:hypothetical protein